MAHQEIKVYQRDYLKKKKDKLLDPEIEKEELLLRKTVTALMVGAPEKLARKLGADKIVKELKDIELAHEKARKNAYRFFNKKSQEKIIYDKNKESYGERDITSDECEEQLEKWALALAREQAERTPQGERIVALRAIKDKCEADIMESNIASELIAKLAGTFLAIGISWEKKIPRLITSRSR
jgi:hypothetical protein